MNHPEGSQATTGMQQQSNRIAKNTIVLFMRMFVLMGLNLYIVRLVLMALGDEDYGTFNAVAGVVTALTCVSSVLAIATQRFYSYTSGKGDSSQLKNIFSVSLNISIVLALIVLILFETLGLWYVGHHLPVPTERLQASLIVYHFSCFSFAFTLIQIPYMAAIIAREDMGYYALISTADCLLRLLVAFLIPYSSGDFLVFYGGGLMCVAFLTMTAYMVLGRRYQECRYHIVADSQLYKQLLSFSGWTFFGSLASVALFQGNTILLYEYFGALATAAFAISIQINHAFNSLCNSTVLAFRPAIIRSYAEGNLVFVTRMFYFGNKFILYILLAIAIPLIAEMKTVLALWLDEVTPETVIFARMMIIAVAVMVMHSPITIIIHATGKVKNYHLICESIMLMCLPLTWVFFICDMPSYACFISMIVVCLLAHIARLVCLSVNFPAFSLSTYLWYLVIPSVLITAIVGGLAYCLHLCSFPPILQLCLSITVIPLVMFSLVYFGGLRSDERTMLHKMLKNLIKKIP